MKRRYRKLLNVFSISLLLIALYLNFVKKETSEVSIPAVKGNTIDPTQADDKESKILTAEQSKHTVVLK